MRRTQIQLEEEIYEALRHRAFKERKSIAGVIRDIVKKELIPSDRPRPSSIQGFKFIGAGRSRQGSLKPVSERHDEALGEVLRK